MKIERRALGAIELRVNQADAGGTPTIMGYAALFDQPSYPMRTAKGSQFREVIKPGAFGDADSADVMARYNHDLILGRTSAGTLKLSVDERGLKYEITPSTSALTDHVVQAVQRGDVKGSSFAFHLLDEKWRVINNENVRELHSVGLVDVGPVDSPAYGSTADGDNAVSLRSLGTDEAVVDAEIGKLAGTATIEEPAKRYYSNGSSSSTTDRLRYCIDSARQMFDNAQVVIDSLAAMRTALTDEEKLAAIDLADELARCQARLGLCVAALTAVGANAVEPTDESRSKTPLLDARQRRFELV